MNKTVEYSLKISPKCNELLERIKKETGSSKKFIMEKALMKQYPEFVEKEDK